MTHLPDVLKERKIVLVKHVAQTVGLDQRTLLRRLDEQSIPVIHLGPRKRALKLSDFDRLIDSLSRTSQTRLGAAAEGFGMSMQPQAA